jgi:hypothetical protein
MEWGGGSDGGGGSKSSFMKCLLVIKIEDKISNVICNFQKRY